MNNHPLKKAQRQLSEPLKWQRSVGNRWGRDSTVRTATLSPISCSGALKSHRKPSVMWRETHYTCWWCLHCAASISAFDPQQGYNLKANTAMSPAQDPPAPPPHTHAQFLIEYSTIVHTYVIVIVRVVVLFVDYKFVHSEALFLVSICFIDGLFPQVYRQATHIPEKNKKKNKNKWKMFKILTFKHHTPILLLSQTENGGEGNRSVWSHLSEKQCAALTTQHGEMREPPQRKRSFSVKIAATQGCDSMGVNEPPTILYIICSDLSPQVSSARTHKMSQRKC